MSWRTTIIQVKWPNENGPPTINIFLLLELTRKSTGRRCLYNYSFSSSVNLSGWYYFGNEWSTRNDVSDWFSCRQRPYFVRDHAPARSHVHLRQPGAFSTNMHTSLGETSLSFFRLLSKELSCHLVIFLATTIANDKGRSKKKKLESYVWCLDDVVRMPATRLPFVVWRAFLQLSVVCWRGWSFADAIQRHHTEAPSNFSKQIIVWNRHVRFRFKLIHLFASWAVKRDRRKGSSRRQHTAQRRCRRHQQSGTWAAEQCMLAWERENGARRYIQYISVLAILRSSVAALTPGHPNQILCPCVCKGQRRE